MKVLEIPLLLASRSPRRKDLLEQAGFTIRVDSVEIDESFPTTMHAEDVAVYLANQKAEATLHLLKEGEVMIAADSVVELDGGIFGKPKSKEEAIVTLTKLSGKAHQVITGVCLMGREKISLFSEHSEVHLASLNLEEIEYYIDNYKPYDKAGSYGIQEWIGLCKVQKIIGTYTNIVGLPVESIYHELEQFI